MRKPRFIPALTTTVAMAMLFSFAGNGSAVTTNDEISIKNISNQKVIHSTTTEKVVNVKANESCKHISNCYDDD
ncbi:hypothetical protein [Effusibacillus consociatus]|uniref:Uncharacterized protein n=1 Tax=Effusibacillus consociatus TaxID=1117041 RepID=A0ABV9Q769_9BACL